MSKPKTMTRTDYNKALGQTGRATRIQASKGRGPVWRSADGVTRSDGLPKPPLVCDESAALEWIKSFKKIRLGKKVKGVRG